MVLCFCVYLYNVSSHHAYISIPQVNVILWTMVSKDSLDWSFMLTNQWLLDIHKW